VVIVDEDQQSLAIGKKGQNVRLASRLCGWDIDIKTRAEFEAENLGIVPPEAEGDGFLGAEAGRDPSTRPGAGDHSPGGKRTSFRRPLPSGARPEPRARRGQSCPRRGPAGL
jgi:hypothetical protein